MTDTVSAAPENHDADASRPRCTAWTRAGMRCRHTSNLIDSLCVFHHPARAAEAQAMRRKGQAAGTAKRLENHRIRLALASQTAGPRPELGNSLETVSLWLRWLGEAAVRGQITRDEALALTTIARLYLSALKERDLERQLRDLQRTHREQQKQLAKLQGSR